MGMSASSNQEVEKIHQSENQQETAVEMEMKESMLSNASKLHLLVSFWYLTLLLLCIIFYDRGLIMSSEIGFKWSSYLMKTFKIEVTWMLPGPVMYSLNSIQGLTYQGTWYIHTYIHAYIYWSPTFMVLFNIVKYTFI